MKIASTLSVTALALLLHVDRSAARSWRDILPIEALIVLDHVDIVKLLNAKDPLFTIPPTFDAASSHAPTFTPTGWPTLTPTIAPTTAKPTLVPTATPSTATPTSLPSSAPSIEPFPENEVPLFADDSYFNYDTRPDARYGPGQPVMVQSGNGFTVSYENNKWADVVTPSDSYWKEFTDDGFGKKVCV